jgi:hypothetical protein
MTEQARTQAKGNNRLVSSDVVMRPDRFDRWKGRFRSALTNSGADTSWKQLLDKGCDPEDLQWALYHAVEMADSASQALRQSDSFLQAKKLVLNDIRRLRLDFQNLTKLQFVGGSAWQQALALSGLKDIPDVFKNLPDWLSAVEQTLQFMDLLVGAVPTKWAQFLMKSRGIALVHAYAEEFAGTQSSEEVADLLDAAARAFGSQESPEFTYEAVVRRQSRYKQKQKGAYADQRRLMKEFKSVRRKDVKITLRIFILKRTIRGYGPHVLEYLRNQAAKQ